MLFCFEQTIRCQGNGLSKEQHNQCWRVIVIYTFPCGMANLEMQLEFISEKLWADLIPYK